jgi:hypothetical protein
MRWGRPLHSVFVTVTVVVICSALWLLRCAPVRDLSEEAREAPAPRRLAIAAEEGVGPRHRARGDAGRLQRGWPAQRPVPTTRGGRSSNGGAHTVIAPAWLHENWR